MDQVKVFAPATIANVACGFDVLGLALDYPGDEVLIKKTDSKQIIITACHNAENLPLEADKNVAGVAVKALLDKLGSDQGFEIELTKGVKPGSGIGSSGASAAGSVYAINKLLGDPFTNKELIKYVKEETKKQLTLTDVVGRSEQLNALEDLKDFAYDNCQPHNSDRLSEIMERL